MTPERRGTVDAVAEALDAAQSIGVVGHVGPDGDALGSMIALSLAARSAGKDAVASFAEPFVVPDEMSFLDTSTLVRPADFPRILTQRWLSIRRSRNEWAASPVRWGRPRNSS